MIISLLLAFSTCITTPTQAQTKTPAIKNVSITIMLYSNSYEEFVNWIKPFSEKFHNFTFIINRENGNFNWFLNNQSRIDFLTSMGEAIPVVGSIQANVGSPGFIQVETPENRIELVNDTITEWKTHLDYAPVGVFMFQPDTVVSNYLKSQNVSYILGYCFEQYLVDWMAMRGGWQLPYYASSQNALMPENNSEFGTLVLPWLTWDWIDSLTLSHNFDSHIMDTKDPAIHLENSTDYIIKLLENNLGSSYPVAYSAFSFEFDWIYYYANAVNHSIYDELSNLVSYIISNDNYEKLSSGNFTKWFQANYNMTPSYSIRFTSPNSQQNVEWFYSTAFRAARTNGTVVSFVDYTNQDVDKYTYSEAKVNLSEPSSPTNCIDNSLRFTIDALGGGTYRHPITGGGIEYSGELSDFINYYYSVVSQGDVLGGYVSTFPVLPNPMPVDPQPTPTPVPRSTPVIPEHLEIFAVPILFSILGFAVYMKFKIKFSASS